MSLTSRDQTSQEEEARWFADEVQPHESGLRAYLRRQFPALTEADDVVQESFLRVLRAKISGKLRSPKNFLFRTARNAAIDVFRRNRTVSLDAAIEIGGFTVIENGPSVSESASRREEIDLLIEAIEALPHRCRQVLKLRKIYDLSHKEIAQQLGISERTVNVQVGRGVRRCAAYLAARNLVILNPKSGQ